MGKTPVLAIVGPTASGKSALALPLARALGGEIVCMDSMQVYRGMDIGTAKPTQAEQAEVPHHLLDVADPREPFSAADYAALAEPALENIWSRGKLPILVGGTGLYLKTLMQGLPLGGVKSDERIRARLWALAEEPDGKERLHSRLKEVDSPSAAKLHPNDLRRVIRALEIYELTGQAMSRQQVEWTETSFAFCLLGATMEREALYSRVNRRVDEMLNQGLLEEVAALLAQGVPADAQAMQGIGYKELAPVVEGHLPLAEAVDTLKQNTRRYAKRQWTWFRAEESIHWVDTREQGALEKALGMAKDFLADGKRNQG